jgi:tetratricopeptide (TPR) repeat protein
MKSQFSVYLRVLTTTALIALFGASVLGQHGTGTGGSGAGGAVGGNAGTVMKLPSKKPTRTPTTRPPRTGTRPTTPDNSAQLEDALSLADDARQNGRDEAAERGYLLATKLAPSDPRAYLGLGHIYYNQKKYPDAEKYYARAASLSRNDSEPYARLAFTYSEMSRLDEALVAAQRSVNAQPDNYYGYLALGYIHSVRHSYPEAEAAYRKGLTLTTQPVLVLHTELARILSDQRKYREALVETKKAVEIDPKDYSTRFQNALIMQKLGQLAPAAAEYLEAAKLNTKDGAPHSNVGLIYYMTEQFSLARQHWNMAISLGSTYAPDRIGLMIIDGRLADARRELEAYTQKSPDDEDGWLMLGDVYRALGDDARARMTDARAAQIAPDYVGLRRPNLKATSASNHGGTSTTGTGEIIVNRVYMARNFPAAASDLTTNFAATDHAIHCVAELNQAREGTLVRFVWKTVSVGSSQNEAFKTTDYTTKAGESRVHGYLTLPDEWPRGTYKVEIYINNTLARSVNYSIQ